MIDPFQEADMSVFQGAVSTGRGNTRVNHK